MNLRKKYTHINTTLSLLMMLVLHMDQKTISLISEPPSGPLHTSVQILLQPTNSFVQYIPIEFLPDTVLVSGEYCISHCSFTAYHLQMKTP